MQTIVTCGVYFANIPLTRVTDNSKCENLNCTYQFCLGCKLESVIIWTQTPDQKSLVIPIIRTTVEQHEQNLGSINDNLALIKLKKSDNNSLLSFREENISYADLNRITWVKNFRISDQYIIDGQLRVLTESEIHDLSWRIKNLPVSTINVINNLNVNKNLNLNNKIISYSDSNMKD